MSTTIPLSPSLPHLQLPPFGCPATIEEWLALPEEKGAELIHGRITYRALPNWDHGRSQVKLSRFLAPFDSRGGGGAKPGGWWFGSEIDMYIAGQGVRPDMAGWRRDRFSSRPRPGPKGVITERPDWVAEILSPSNADYDRQVKLNIYLDAGIPHYWILDPEGRTLLTHRRHPDGYILVEGANATRTVNAEPFESVELPVRYLFPTDDD